MPLLSVKNGTEVSMRPMSSTRKTRILGFLAANDAEVQRWVRSSRARVDFMR